MSNVRAFTDKELLERVESIGGKIPNIGKYLIIGVQSQEDAFNLFDDKFYVFDGHKFVQWSTGTTNPGKTALLHFDQYSLQGALIWKTDQWCPDVFEKGMHKASRKGGGMRALRQVKPIYFYRDTDKDLKAEEQGELFYDIAYTNMHGVDYNPYSDRISVEINGWSFGCQVWNRMGDYRQMQTAVWKRAKPVDYALLKEWE